MKRIALAATAVLATFALSGCGGFQQGISSQTAFSQTLDDGRVVQCVQVTGAQGSVAVTCDFENSEEVTP